MDNQICEKCFHAVTDHNTLGVCQKSFCRCTTHKLAEIQIEKETNYLCLNCNHPKSNHRYTFDHQEAAACAQCSCVAFVQPRFTSSIEDSKVSIQKGNEVTHQDLEPNAVRIFTKGDQIEFSVQCKRFDMEMCIEETVEAYNKLAKALGKKEVHLNQIIGAPIVEEHQSFKEKYKVNDDFEEKHAVVKIKDKNPKAFHNRLRKYRIESGIQLIAVCEKLNYDPYHYAEIEKGLLNPSNITEDQLLEISNILNLEDSKFKRLVASHKPF